MHFLDLTLGIRFEPVLSGLSRLKEIAPYISMQMVRLNKTNIIYSNNTKTNRNELIRRLLSGLTDDELENLVRLREEARRPIPAPRKMGVKQLIRYFENNNLYKPLWPNKQQSQPEPIPAPRTKKQQPVAAPRTKIGEKQRALKGFTKSYEIGLKTDRDALVQLQNTRLAISRLFNTILNNTKGFKFCGGKYLDTEVRVRDHCHITGKYRGSAHQDCNLKLRISPKEFKVPVIFHNLCGYDSHFIMKEIGSIGKSNNLYR